MRVARLAKVAKESKGRASSSVGSSNSDGSKRNIRSNICNKHMQQTELKPAILTYLQDSFATQPHAPCAFASRLPLGPRPRRGSPHSPQRIPIRLAASAFRIFPGRRPAPGAPERSGGPTSGGEGPVVGRR